MVKYSDSRRFGYVQNAVDVKAHRRAVVSSGDVRISVKWNWVAGGYAVERRVAADAENGSSGRSGKAGEQKSVGLAIAAAETAFKQNVARTR